jgi:hypothetical protein
MHEHRVLRDAMAEGNNLRRTLSHVRRLLRSGIRLLEVPSLDPVASGRWAWHVEQCLGKVFCPPCTHADVAGLSRCVCLSPLDMPADPAAIARLRANIAASNRRLTLNWLTLLAVAAEQLELVKETPQALAALSGRGAAL